MNNHNQSGGVPVYLIGRCGVTVLFLFCSWFVLVPLFSCYAFSLRLNRVQPLPPPQIYCRYTSPSPSASTNVDTSY